MSSLFSKKSKRQRIEKCAQTPDIPLAGDIPLFSESTATCTSAVPSPSSIGTFADLNLCAPLLRTCASLGYKRPTSVQRTVIPAILSSQRQHVLALSATGSGKTAAFALPMLHTLSSDPYGIYGVVLTPTRELAKQIDEQFQALGSSLRVRTALVVGGMDMVKQSCELARKPHFCIATPGRLAALLRGPNPPNLRNVRYVVLDEADRLLTAKSGFERDVAEVLLHTTTMPDGSGGAAKRVRRAKCQTLLFSATLTRSLASLEEMAGAGLGRLPLKKYIIGDEKDDDDGEKKKKKKKKRKSSDGEESHDIGSDVGSTTEDGESDEEEMAPSGPSIPAGLRQEYIFMPSHVRDAYLLTAVRSLMANGGRHGGGDQGGRRDGSGWNGNGNQGWDSDEDDEETTKKARSAIIFVSTCERAALVSGILTELGVENVALHSLLSQNRRLASLGKFKSQQVRVMVATDVASRGLDIPTVDLVLNAELPRRPVDYVHRVGRTARAGRRGRAVSLVGERDVSLIHAAEKISGRDEPMAKCPEVTDSLAVKLLGPVTKAARLTKMKLSDIGFDDLVKRHKERKARDRRERIKAERAARKAAKRGLKRTTISA
mmetsp:Transcript_7094/g.14842  ORF Transcript_7094/g.14842 Transcript_7094/m.14842 type:complete len:602 (+) Transcript_7094:164-1969(+)